MSLWDFNKRAEKLESRIERIESVLFPAAQEIHWLDGLRVECIRDGEIGTVLKVWLNRNRQPVQIVAEMDSGGVRCFLPHHLSIHASSFLGRRSNVKRRTG